MATSNKSPIISIGVNCKIASRIIELHQRGYVFDFEILSDYQVYCVQENCFISLKDLSIRVIDQCFDQLTHCYKYIHTIESGCGKKGVLLSDHINNHAQLTLAQAGKINPTN